MNLFINGVTFLQAAPYTMLKETSQKLVGNDRYEGFCIDLIDEISKHLGFNYTFSVSSATVLCNLYIFIDNISKFLISQK